MMKKFTRFLLVGFVLALPVTAFSFRSVSPMEASRGFARVEALPRPVSFLAMHDVSWRSFHPDSGESESSGFESTGSTLRGEASIDTVLHRDRVFMVDVALARLAKKSGIPVADFPRDVVRLLRKMERQQQQRSSLLFVEGCCEELLGLLDGNDPSAREFLLDLVLSWRGSLDRENPLVDFLFAQLDGVTDPEFRTRRIHEMFARNTVSQEWMRAEVKRHGGFSGFFSLPGLADVKRLVLDLMDSSDLADPRVASAVHELFWSELDGEMRRKVIETLFQAPQTPDSAKFFEAVLGEVTDSTLRHVAMQAASLNSDPYLLAKMIEIARDDRDVIARRFAVNALGNQETRSEVVDGILDSYGDEDFGVRSNAIRAMKRHIGDPRVESTLSEIIANPTTPDDLVIQALEALRWSPHSSSMDVLEMASASGKTDAVRSAAQTILSRKRARG